MSIVVAITAGFLTILAPCILPILPVLLSAGTKQGRWRPFGISVGIVLSFSMTTLLLSWAIQFLHIPPSLHRMLGISIICIFGVLMVFPALTDRFSAIGYRVFPWLAQAGARQGWWGGLMLGLGLGAIWAPCVGPILGTVIIAAQSDTITHTIVITAVAYAVGVAIPLGLIAVLGQRLRKSIRVVSAWSGPLQRLTGILLILYSIGFTFQIDAKIQSWVLQRRPKWVPLLQQCESGVPLKIQKENTLLQLEVDMEGKF